jgi:hypothetical protein
MGSGFAANQKLAGARDPEAAARMAALPEEEHREQAKAAEQAVENVQSKVHEIMDGIQSGWEPKLEGFTGNRPKGEEAWLAFLESQTPDVVLEVHAELQAAIDEGINQETDRIAAERLMEGMTITPEDPMYDPLVDRRRRERIEDSLEPMDIADMIFKGYVKQDVPLGNGLTLALRSIPTIHGLWIEWHVSRIVEDDSSMQLLRHTLSLLQLAAALDSVNGKTTGPDLTKFTEDHQRDMFLDALKKRMTFVGRLPQEITNDFIVQNVWFSGRLRKVLAGNMMEKVGNS